MSRRQITSNPYVVGACVGTLALLVFYVTAWFCAPKYFHTGSWDEGWYQNIAQHGYKITNDDFRIHQNTAFSPGLPLLHRFFIQVTGFEFRTGRMVLSAVLFLLTCVGLHKVLSTFSRNSWVNNWALLFFCFWPGTLYFMSGYAESLYATLLVWFFYHLLRKRWLIASVFIGMAMFTRSPAAILIPTLGISMFFGELTDHGALKALGRSLGRFLLLLPVMISGLAGYMWLLWSETGDPLAFQKAYVAWIPYEATNLDGLSWQGLFTAFVVRDYYPFITKVGLVGFLLIPVVVFTMRKRLPVELMTFSVVGWLFFLFMDRHHEPFIDILRWSAVFFPVPYCIASGIGSLADWRIRTGPIPSSPLEDEHTGADLGSSLVSRPGRAPALALGAIWLLVSGVLFVHAVCRFSRNEWVS